MPTRNSDTRSALRLTVLYQKRYRKERRCRRKLEQELHKLQQMNGCVPHQTDGLSPGARTASPDLDKDAGAVAAHKQGQMGGRGSPEAASSETEAERPSSLEATAD